MESGRRAFPRIPELTGPLGEMAVHSDAILGLTVRLGQTRAHHELARRRFCRTRPPLRPSLEASSEIHR